MTNNLCDSCNDGYYQIYNEDPDAFKHCYNEKPEGHYFDNINQTFKPCYSNCKNCDYFGNEENNKCTPYDQFDELHGKDNAWFFEVLYPKVQFQPTIPGIPVLILYQTYY